MINENLSLLTLYDNPIKSYEPPIPPDLNAVRTLKEHFLRKEEENKVKVKLPVKVILLGNHATGKSILSNFLIENNLYAQDSTHILDIKHYEKDEKTNLPKAVFFDFGGQDYYHGLYRIYLSKEAVNLILWTEQTNFNRYISEEWSSSL